jgi:hypothetical protein
MVEIQGVARVAPKLLALYRERIAHIVRSFDTGGGGGMGVHRQKELGTNYQGWIQDHNQRHNQRQHNEGSRFKASRLVKDVSQQFDATNAHVHVCHVEDDKGYVQDLVHRVVGVSNSGCVCSLASFLLLCLCLFVVCVFFVVLCLCVLFLFLSPHPLSHQLVAILPHPDVGHPGRTPLGFQTGWSVAVARRLHAHAADSRHVPGEGRSRRHATDGILGH